MQCFTLVLPPRASPRTSEKPIDPVGSAVPQASKGPQTRAETTICPRDRAPVINTHGCKATSDFAASRNATVRLVRTRRTASPYAGGATRLRVTIITPRGRAAFNPHTSPLRYIIVISLAERRAAVRGQY